MDELIERLEAIVASDVFTYEDVETVRQAAAVLHTVREAPVAAFDAAVAAELPRVSQVEYNSHEICKHFAAEVRKRLVPVGEGEA